MIHYLHQPRRWLSDHYYCSRWYGRNIVFPLQHKDLATRYPPHGPNTAIQQGLNGDFRFFRPLTLKCQVADPKRPGL
jgi:hypothetical protein